MEQFRSQPLQDWEMAGQLVADRGAVALQYGSGQGDPGLRAGICEVLSEG